MLIDHQNIQDLKTEQVHQVLCSPWPFPLMIHLKKKTPFTECHFPFSFSLYHSDSQSSIDCLLLDWTIRPILIFSPLFSSIRTPVIDDVVVIIIFSYCINFRICILNNLITKRVIFILISSIRRRRKVPFDFSSFRIIFKQIVCSFWRSVFNLLFSNILTSS